MEVIQPRIPNESRPQTLSRRRPQSSRLRMKIDQTYSYFAKQVDPLIAACVANFVYSQPIDIVGAMRTYFGNLQDKEPFRGLVCYEPKKEQKTYFTLYLGPTLSKLVDAIARSQPSDVKWFICDELSKNVARFDCEDISIILDSAANVSSDANELANTVTNDIDTSSTRNKLSDAIDLANTIAPNIDDITADIAISKPITVPIKAGYDSSDNKENEEPSIITTKHENTIVTTTSTIQKETSLTTKAAIKNIQISILGSSGSGKTSIVNALQGRFDMKVKPSLGFKPTTMMLGENINVKFYDLGGGFKIRGIWGEYYHDVHAVIYMFDSSLKKEELKESIALFQSTINHPLLIGKPVLICANKQDKQHALSMSQLMELIEVNKFKNNGLETIECSSFLSITVNNLFDQENDLGDGISDVIPEDSTIDPRFEKGLDNFLEIIQKDFINLDKRVKLDIDKKQNEGLKKKMERERKVLKNKIAMAFRYVTCSIIFLYFPIYS
jgi:small GTP-binding protein